MFPLNKFQQYKYAWTKKLTLFPSFLVHCYFLELNMLLKNIKIGY